MERAKTTKAVLNEPLVPFATFEKEPVGRVVPWRWLCLLQLSANA